MCVFYIPWICCKAATFFQDVSLIWIKCIGGWMVCYHNIIFQKNGKKNKEGDQKKEEETKVIQFMINTPMFTN